MQDQSIYVVCLLALGVWGGCGHTFLKEVDERNETYEARISRQAAEARRASDLLTYDEKKLHGGLYYVLRLAEQSDTSEAKRTEFERVMLWQGDSTGRIRVSVTLGGMSAIDCVSKELDSLGIEVELKSTSSPHILCLVHPLDLWKIILIASVESIDTIHPGYHN